MDVTFSLLIHYWDTTATFVHWIISSRFHTLQCVKSNNALFGSGPNTFYHTVKNALSPQEKLYRLFNPVRDICRWSYLSDTKLWNNHGTVSSLCRYRRSCFVGDGDENVGIRVLIHTVILEWVNGTVSSLQSVLFKKLFLSILLPRILKSFKVWNHIYGANVFLFLVNSELEALRPCKGKLIGKEETAGWLFLGLQTY